MSKYQCSCGKKFRSYAAEAKHRHNFPVMCNPVKTVYVDMSAHIVDFLTERNRKLETVLKQSIEWIENNRKVDEPFEPDSFFFKALDLLK